MEFEGSRLLRDEEFHLLEVLAARAGMFVEDADRRQFTVVDMNDGGMGSVRFVGTGTETFGSQVARVTFNDDDGTLVDAVLNIDRDGLLYEIDIWRVDSEPLQRIPLDLTRDETE